MYQAALGNSCFRLTPLFSLLSFSILCLWLNTDMESLATIEIEPGKRRESNKFKP